jgi:hypothetical protein
MSALMKSNTNDTCSPALERDSLLGAAASIRGCECHCYPSATLKTDALVIIKSSEAESETCVASAAVLDKYFFGEGAKAD